MLFDLGVELVKIMQTGLILSGCGLIGFVVSRGLAPILGYKPPEVHHFKRIFDRFYNTLLGPVEREMGTVSRSPRKTQLLMIATMGIVTALFAIALELWGMIAMTGMTFAGYKLFGITPDLLSLYHSVIVCVTLLAMALMARGSKRAHHLPRYQ